jgi:peptidoglycan DL-endopeptidase CwlO
MIRPREPAWPGRKVPTPLYSHRRVLRFAAPLVAALALLLAPGAAHASPSKAQLQAQIDAASKKLELTVEQYDKSSQDLKNTKAAIVKLDTDLGPLAKKRDDARREVAAVAVSAYTGSGKLAKWNALLGSGSPTAVMDRLGTLQQLAISQNLVIENSRDATAKYDSQRTQLDAARGKANTELAQLSAQKTQIETDLKKLEAQKKQLYPNRPVQATGSRYTGAIPAISGKAGVAVKFAYNQIGKPYAWGADGPGSYDCSGLTMAAWRAAGVSLYHQAAEQWNEVAHISRSSLQPGDLVFYSGLGHVAIYIGGGKVIHAPTFGETVKIASVDMMTPYGYGRVRA